MIDFLSNILKQILKQISKTMKSFNKLSLIHKLFIITLVLLFAIVINNYNNYNNSFSNSLENYDNNNLLFKENYFELKRNNEVYDDLYASYYDKIHIDQEKYKYEIGELDYLLNNSQTKSNYFKLLDVGCGTGYQVNELQKKYKNCKISGLDKSQAMIDKASLNYPKCNFFVDNILNTKNLDYNSQNIVTCMNKTFYEFNDKEQNTLLDNIYNILDPNGYFIVHLLNREKFDPFILYNSKDDKILVDPNKYNTKINGSIIKFDNNIEYSGNYKLLKDEKKVDSFNNLKNNNTAYSIYKEQIKNFSTNAVRKNEIEMFIDPLNNVVQKIKNKGYDLVKRINMEPKYNGEYIFVFKK
jgi:SAM-dependent methyltransferase